LFYFTFSFRNYLNAICDLSRDFDRNDHDAIIVANDDISGPHPQSPARHFDID